MRRYELLFNEANVVVSKKTNGSFAVRYCECAWGSVQYRTEQGMRLVSFRYFEKNRPIYLGVKGRAQILLVPGDDALSVFIDGQQILTEDIVDCFLYVKTDAETIAAIIAPKLSEIASPQKILVTKAAEVEAMLRALAAAKLFEVVADSKEALSRGEP